jgi:hypothetical protein
MRFSARDALVGEPGRPIDTCGEHLLCSFPVSVSDHRATATVWIAAPMTDSYELETSCELERLTRGRSAQVGVGRLAEVV